MGFTVSYVRPNTVTYARNARTTTKGSRVGRAISYRWGGRLLSPVRELALKLKDVRTEIIREDNGSYAVACSALGVYAVGRTLKEAKRNFERALDLHLSVVREKARKDLATLTVSA